MSEIEFELNLEGIEALLKGEEMEKALKSCADKIRESAGSGYGSDTKMMGTRVIASVYTGDRRSYIDNMRNNTLLKAVQSHD